MHSCAPELRIQNQKRAFSSQRFCSVQMRKRRAAHTAVRNFCSPTTTGRQRRKPSGSAKRISSSGRATNRRGRCTARLPGSVSATEKRKRGVRAAPEESGARSAHSTACRRTPRRAGRCGRARSCTEPSPRYGRTAGVVQTTVYLQCSTAPTAPRRIPHAKPPTALCRRAGPAGITADIPGLERHPPARQPRGRPALQPRPPPPQPAAPRHATPPPPHGPSRPRGAPPDGRSPAAPPPVAAPGAAPATAAAAPAGSSAPPRCSPEPPAAPGAASPAPCPRRGRARQVRAAAGKGPACGGLRPSERCPGSGSRRVPGKKRVSRRVRAPSCP